MYNGYYEYKGDILKWSPNKGYFLKMTGWDDINPDRRVLSCEINTDKLNSISKDWALEAINTFWNSGIREWEFNGQKYNNSIQDWHKIPFHDFPHTWYEEYKSVFDEALGKYVRKLLPEPIEHTYYNKYKLVWHQGHIYWAIGDGNYWPRIQLISVESIDSEPSYSNFHKWTSVHNCRGIRNIKDNKIV